MERLRAHGLQRAPVEVALLRSLADVRVDTLLPDILLQDVVDLLGGLLRRRVLRDATRRLHDGRGQRTDEEAFARVGKHLPEVPVVVLQKQIGEHLVAELGGKFFKSFAEGIRNRQKRVLRALILRDAPDEALQRVVCRALAEHARHAVEHLLCQHFQRTVRHAVGHGLLPGRAALQSVGRSRACRLREQNVQRRAGDRNV